MDPPQACREETVGAGAVGKCAHEIAGEALGRKTVGRRVEAELPRKSFRESLDLLVALFRRQRTDRVDEEAARLHVALDGSEQPGLQLREPIDVFRRAPQLHFRMPAERAEAGTGRVEEDEAEA